MPNEMKQLESLESRESRSATKEWKLNPVLADYAKEIFIFIVSLTKNHFKEKPRFLSHFCLFALFH